jgi:hypothetical protein
MPRRVTATPVSPLSRPVINNPRPATITAPSPAWATGSTRAASKREAPLDRWARLHTAPLEVPERRTAVISQRARDLASSVSTSGSRMSPRLAQDMLDGLTAAGLAEPMWPHLKSMGFGEHEAAAIHDQLKSFENDRRTSLSSMGGGVARLATEGKQVKALATVVEALVAGKTPDLSKLPPAVSTALTNAKRLGAGEQLEAARALLELRLGAFITDSPIDLIDGDPAAARAGLEAALSAQTQQVSKAEAAGDLRLMKHHGFTAFGLLKELAVLDPAAAQKAGAAFAKALHESERRIGITVLD